MRNSSRRWRTFLTTRRARSWCAWTRPESSCQAGAGGHLRQRKCPQWRVESFHVFAPLAGWRRVDVTDRRTKRDWARQIRKLVGEDFPGKRIFLAMDNLNTHGAGSLYETFPPSEAHRILAQLTFICTPRHGSWLNMAEIEIGAMVRQCLARRIPDQATLRKEVQAWQERRNNDLTRADWRFRTADARIKLKSLYPALQ